MPIAPPPAIVHETNDLINAMSRLCRQIDRDYTDLCLDTCMTMSTEYLPANDAQRVVFDLMAVGFMLNASGLADRDEAEVVRYHSYREG